MYTYGDIVKPKFSRSGVEYYIITDVYDFSKSEDGSDMRYEIMKIYPITKSSPIANIDENKINLIGKGDKKEGKLIIDFVMQERKKRGWEDTPDFVVVIKNNLQSAKKGNIIKKPTDTIRYDKLRDINDCLQAINDLNQLHKMFGDEAYLQLKELVIDRIKDLKNRG